MTFSPPFIIAEMACSHDGQTDLAKIIIDGAGQAGANAIQFQVWILKKMMVSHHPDFKRVSEIELSPKEWTGLAEYVRDRYPTMQIIACIYERDSVDLCEQIGVDAYKLHSADLSNPYLVKHVAQTRKRIDLSVGASTLDEIQTALGWIREISDSEIWMMYGYQNFPTPTDAIHLSYMQKLKGLFDLPVGYQDHSDANSPAAFWLPATAMGMGIHIQEKHITHNRSFKGIDHEAALNPDEFAEFVEMIHLLESAMGNPTPKPFSEEEKKYRIYAKKSLVACRDLPAGTLICEDDLVFMRADELGLPPDQAYRLLGRTTRSDISAQSLVQEDDLV